MASRPGCAVSDRRFRFGVTNGAVMDMASWTDAAQRAESLGYSTFLIPDTLRTPAPLPALAAAAAVTSSLRVGTWVLCDSLRNPRTLAWEVASLDRLSGGRVELGIGAGRPDAEQDARRLDVTYGSPGERIDRLAASVALLRRLLDGGEDGFPSAAGRVPIMIAASGPRLLGYAAQHADIIALGWPPTTTAEQARPLIDRLRASPRFEDVELATGLIAVGEEQHPWLQRMGLDAAALAAGHALTVVTGSPRQMADTLLWRRDQLSVSYLTVPAQSAEAFAPVVELLTGT
jgi:probable F420-dependent oxidoreductase